MLNLSSHHVSKASHRENMGLFLCLLKRSQGNDTRTEQAYLQYCSQPCRYISCRDLPGIVDQSNAANIPHESMPSHDATASQSMSQNKV